MKRVTFWLAQPDTPKGGIKRVLDEVEALGINASLSVRIGQAGRLENGVDERTIKLCQERLGNDRVEVWWGSHPTTTDDELKLAKRFHAIGVRRFVANAETAWKREGTEAIASRFSDKLIAEITDSEIGHAPFAMMQSHGHNGTYAGKPVYKFPYLGFAKLHAAYLQMYPNEFGGSRAYWGERYEREVKAFLKANPALAKQRIIAMGDIYGADFGRSWGLTPAPVKWADDHLDQHLALSERMGDTEQAFYSIDAALSESERAVKGQTSQSNPWGAVKRWAERLRAANGLSAQEPTYNAADFYDEETGMCMIPGACYSKQDHVGCA